MSLADRFEYLPLGAFEPCGGRMRLHGGGDGGGSSSSNSTTTTTTNVDRRQVVDNGAVGITSDGGTVNISNTKTDYGVVDAAAGLIDEAIAGVIASAAASGNAIERAYTSSGNDKSTAYKQAADFADAIAGRSFDLAATSSEQGYKTINTAIGFVKDVLTLASDSTKIAAAGVSSAYSTAQDSATGTRFLMTAALAIGGIILVVNLPKMKGG